LLFEMVGTYFSHFVCHGDIGMSSPETMGMGSAVASAINQTPAMMKVA